VYPKIERFPVKVLISVLILMLLILVPAAAFAQTVDPEISIKKSVSFDGGLTWEDADPTDGLYIAIPKEVLYKFEVTNSGNVTLTAITLSDNVLDLSGATIVDPLAPGGSFDYIKAKFVNTIGLHTNTATATAVYNVYQQVTASDVVYYYGHTPPYIPPIYIPPTTINPSITVEKYVSIEGGSWLDAETAPGPGAQVGKMVRFRFVVTNSGNVTLNNITLTDNKFSLPGASFPASLAPGGSFEYTLTGISALAGQHSNTATATGTYGQQVVSDTDKGHYFGSVTVTPSIRVKKHVSVDKGVTWYDAETIAAGPDAIVGAKVKFRFEVTNTGNATLTNITLTDSEYSLSGVTVPATLAAGASFERFIEVTAVKGRHVNTATATGRYDGQTYSDTDKANYYGYVPYTPPPKPDPVKPTPPPEPEKPKPKPTPPTDGAYTSGLYYALVLFILAAIALKKGFPQGLALKLNKKR
jgi:hypothetical protein